MIGNNCDAWPILAYQTPLIIFPKLTSMAEQEINIAEPFKQTEHCFESATETPLNVTFLEKSSHTY